jgi:hypothetical protein
MGLIMTCYGSASTIQMVNAGLGPTKKSKPNLTSLLAEWQILSDLPNSVSYETIKTLNLMILWRILRSSKAPSV